MNDVVNNEVRSLWLDTLRFMEKERKEYQTAELWRAAQVLSVVEETAAGESVQFLWVGFRHRAEEARRVLGDPERCFDLLLNGLRTTVRFAKLFAVIPFDVTTGESFVAGDWPEWKRYVVNYGRQPKHKQKVTGTIVTIETGGPEAADQ